MGGSGSGEWRSRGAVQVEDALRLDLNALRQKGGLQAGRKGVISWELPDGRTASMGFTSQPGLLSLSFTWNRPGADPERHRQGIRLVSVPAGFGGHRTWFLCPGCQRRCGALFIIGEVRCRACHKLTYRSQYQPAWVRAINRLERIAGRLDASDMDGQMVRPKGMQRRTYQALTDAVGPIAGHVEAMLRAKAL